MASGRAFPDAYVDDCVRYGPRRFGERWCSVRQVIRKGGWHSQMHTAEPATDAAGAVGRAAQRAFVDREHRKAAKGEGDAD